MSTFRRIFSIFTLLSCLPTFSPSLCENSMWRFGFSAKPIQPNPESSQHLYIAGYNNALEISGILDLCQARAAWIEAEGSGFLLIGIDCVALDSGTVNAIRASLSDLTDCAQINVYATHTHAGPDTLGLWGEVGKDGKNADYMASLTKAAEEAAREAHANRKNARLFYGKAKTENMYRDSRLPEVFDANLYQLRFQAENGQSGLRLFFYGAHAESLRGSNSLLSRDFPGLLIDGIFAKTGDEGMFLPGAIGGLIMTKAFVPDTGRQALENLRITADKLIAYALSILPENERELAPTLSMHREVFTVPLENPVFLLYKSLGILNNRAVPSAESKTGFAVETELNVLKLGGLPVALIPGEMFPELATGEAYGDANPEGKNPEPLCSIAKRLGHDEFLIIGLANDELGYIVPPSDFLLNEKNPYIERTMDSKGEDHYEETNSVGPECAGRIAEAFEKALTAVR